MKNLHKHKKRETLVNAAAIAIAVIPIVLMALMRIISAEFLAGKENIIAIASMIVCWGAAVYIIAKKFKENIIIEAMLKNETRLRTDRKSFPSNNKITSIDNLKTIFENSGYSVSDNTDTSFKAELKHKKTVIRFFAADSSHNTEEFFSEVAAEAEKDEAKLPAYCACIIESRVSASDEEAAKDVKAAGSGCVMRMYYSTEENRAYYMGGFCGNNTAEKYIQDEIKRTVLGFIQDFPKKTENDITVEEKEFDSLDFEEILMQMQGATEQDKNLITEMRDGEIRLVFDGNYGTIYYRTENRGISHIFKLDENDGKHLLITELELAYYCYPKAKPVSRTDLYPFKDCLEKYLTENGYTFTYQNE